MSEAPEIRPAHFHSLVPHPLTALLRVRPLSGGRPPAHSCESGYHLVYRTRPHVDRWCAKVRVNGQLTRLRGSASAMPHQAALFAVLWFQDRYGINWQRALVARAANRRPSWRVWQQRVARAVVRTVRGRTRIRMVRGWCARVWEFGRPVEVTGQRKPGLALEAFDSLGSVRFCERHWRRPGRLLVFATRAEAEAASRVWVCRRWGLFGDLAVWRS